MKKLIIALALVAVILVVAYNIMEMVFTVVLTDKVVTAMTDIGSDTTQQAVVPVTEEYSTNRELLDWYTSLGSMRTKTNDATPASVMVEVVLGYKKEDKAISTEITQKSIELKDFLRRYFSQKSAEELAPQNEENLKIEIRNAINDQILSGSKIKDIRFMQLDVISQ